MIVVGDTSPIDYLVLIGAIDVLPALYQKIVVPTAVYNELQTKKFLSEKTNGVKSLENLIEECKVDTGIADLAKQYNYYLYNSSDSF